MQVYENSNKLNLKTILLFCAILFVAFLPISSFLFSLKNDAFSGYFPPKFFMSESIHSSTLPLWNPYINFGIPQYGDMSSGFWSPITWLIASTTGYNAYTFTLELLLYILLGGVGMYKLLEYWNIDNKIKFIAGISFMCSGFNIGHLQHFNWLSGAAFLPWSIWAYLTFIDNFSIGKSIRLALMFYLLVSSAHPGISIGAFFLFLTIFIFTFTKNHKPQNLQTEIKQSFNKHIILIIFFVLLSAGMIAGYMDILPQFSRGEKLSLENSLSNPTSISCWISTLIPLASVKNEVLYNTDISMRNCYFGIALLLVFISFVFSTKTKWQILFLVFGLSFALLSLGGIFKTIGYKLIPGISYIRLNGEFRIFTILCFIIIAAIELNKYTFQENKFENILKKIFLVLELILICTVIYALYEAIHNKLSFFYAIESINKQIGTSNKLKGLLDALSFYDTLWIQGALQIIILWGIKKSLINRNFGTLKKIVIAELVLASLLNIPFTGVGKASLANVQVVLNNSKKGIPIPTLTTVANHDTLTPAEKGLVGDWSMYNKEIGTIQEVPYPILLNNTVLYFSSIAKNKKLSVANKPYLFVANTLLDSNSSISKVNSINKYTIAVQNFSANKIEIFIKSDTNSNLYYLQNYYPHWFYSLGKEKNEMKKAGINFMYAPINKDNNTIVFSFEPTWVKIMMLVSLFSLITFTIILFFNKTKQPSPSLH